MGKPVSGLNGKMLAWARERSGQTVAQVAQALGRDSEEIEAWESNQAAPTYPQLERLAYNVYKRPLALFFFPEPPDETDPKTSFRTLPTVEIEDLSADTRYKIRQARALQLDIRELSGGKNPAKELIFKDLKRGNAPVATLALKARDYLGVSLELQRDVLKTPDDALKEWRTAVEDKGVYVFKNSFKQRDVSGFCLYDPDFPLIYVNNTTAKTRQSFTILHELGHILSGTSGITKRDDSYIKSLKGDERQIEVFCNQFASECLLPTAEFKRVAKLHDDESVAALARQYKVSRQMVLLRFLSLGQVSQAHYDKKSAEWTAEYEATKAGDEGGGNYYNTQASYLGERFLRFAFGKYYEGKLSLEQLADFLNVRVSSVPGLEQTFLQSPKP